MKGKFQRFIALAMTAMLATTSWVNASMLTIPKLQYSDLVAGDDGYVQLHQYVTPTTEAGVYRDRLSVSVGVVPPTMDVVLVVDGSSEVANLAPGVTNLGAQRSAWQQICDGIAAAGDIFLNPTLNPSGKGGATNTRLWVVVYDKEAYVMDQSGNLSAAGSAGSYFVSNESSAASIPRQTYSNSAAVNIGSSADYSAFKSAVNNLRKSNYPSSAKDERYIAKGLARAYDILYDTTPSITGSTSASVLQESARKCVFLLSSGGDYEDVLNSATGATTKSYSDPKEVLLESEMRKEAIFVAKALKAENDKYTWAINPSTKQPVVVSDNSAASPQPPIWKSFQDSIVNEVTGPSGSTTPTGQKILASKFVERLTHEIRSSSTQNIENKSLSSTPITAGPHNLKNQIGIATGETLGANVIDDSIPGVDGYTVKKNSRYLSDTYVRISDHGGMGAEIWTIALGDSKANKHDAPSTLPKKGVDTAKAAHNQIIDTISGTGTLTSADISTKTWQSSKRDYGVRSATGSDGAGVDTYDPIKSHWIYNTSQFPTSVPIPFDMTDIWLNSMTSQPSGSASNDPSYKHVSYAYRFNLDIASTPTGKHGDPLCSLDHTTSGQAAKYSSIATINGGVGVNARAAVPTANKVNTSITIPSQNHHYPVDKVNPGLGAHNGVNGQHNDYISDYLITLAGNYSSDYQGMQNSNWSDNYNSFGSKRVWLNQVKSDPWTFYDSSKKHDYWYETSNTGNPIPTSHVIHHSTTTLHYYLNEYHYGEIIGMDLKLNGYGKALQEYRNHNLNYDSSSADNMSSEYPLQYRWVASDSDNEMVKWQFQKYAYEMFAVSPGGNAYAEASQYYTVQQGVTTFVDSVIPKEFLDGAGNASSSGNDVYWKLPRLYLGSFYYLDFNVKFHASSDLQSGTWYPVIEDAYVDLPIITMMPNYSGKLGSRFNTLANVIRVFPHATLSAIEGEGSIEPKEDIDHRLDDSNVVAKQTSSAVFSIPTNSSSGSASSATSSQTIIVEPVTVDESTEEVEMPIDDETEAAEEEPVYEEPIPQQDDEYDDDEISFDDDNDDELFDDDDVPYIEDENGSVRPASIKKGGSRPPKTADPSENVMAFAGMGLGFIAVALIIALRIRKIKGN